MTKFFQKFRKAGIFALILGLLWQSSALSSIVNIGHAKAGTTTIALNEFVSDSTQEWVELYNYTASPIDLTGWKLTDLKTPASTPTEQDMLALNGTIDAHSVLAFNVSGLNNPQDSIGLYNGAIEVDRVTYGTVSGYTTNVAAPSTDLSAARLPDGIGGWYTDQTPTKDNINLDPLTVDAGGDKIANAQITQDGTVTGGQAPYTYKWEQISGPGTVTFGSSTAEDTTIQANTDGSYTIKFTATDQYSTTSYATMNLTWDTTKPVIDNIDLDQTTYNIVDFPQPITGNAHDETSEITKVEVKIKDNTTSPATFWDGNSWVTDSNTWNLATSTTSWSYQFDPANMTLGHAYDVKAKAYDSLDQESTVVAKSFTYIDDVAPTITLTPDTTAITNQNITITADVDGTGSAIVETKWAAGDKDIAYFATQGTTFTNTFTVDANNTYTVYAEDAEGNEAVKTIDITNIDKTAPTGSIKINNGAAITNTKNVTLNLTYSDTNIDKMRIANDKSKFTPTCTEGEWQDVKETLDWTLTDGEGEKTVYVQYKDKAGNISKTYEDSINYVVKATNIRTYNVSNGSTTSIIVGNLLIDVTANTTANTTLTSAEYSDNPGTSHSFQFFGKYFDLTFEDDSKIKYPVSIDIYYTQTDLDAAGITESQITGLYYYDSSSASWELYPNQTIDTTNINGYEGKISLNVDHLTPLVLGADTTAPSTPDGFKAEAKDGSVKLTWNKVDDADHYDIRYRKSTDNNDSVSYSEIYITTDTETEITGLENNVEYEFDIRAVDIADNKGEWSVVVATPKLSTEEAARRAELAKQVAYYGTVASNNGTSVSSSTNIDENKDNDGEVIVDDGGEVKAENSTEGETEGARTAVTLGIIIIAIGAALGGYYGYQWWLGEGEVEEETVPQEKKTPKPKKKKKSNRRW